MSQTIITIRYVSDAPYTESEAEAILSDVKDMLTDIDGDADGKSFSITARNEAEETDAKVQNVIDYFNESEISATFNIVNGASNLSFQLAESEEN